MTHSNYYFAKQEKYGLSLSSKNSWLFAPYAAVNLYKSTKQRPNLFILFIVSCEKYKFNIIT